MASAVFTALWSSYTQIGMIVVNKKSVVPVSGSGWYLKMAAAVT